jgi:hypothetical protein
MVSTMGKMIIIPVQPNRFNGFDIVEMKLHRQIQRSGNSSENNPQLIDNLAIEVHILRVLRVLCL